MYNNKHVEQKNGRREPGKTKRKKQQQHKEKEKRKFKKYSPQQQERVVTPKSPKEGKQFSAFPRFWVKTEVKFWHSVEEAVAFGENWREFPLFFISKIEKV